MKKAISITILIIILTSAISDCGTDEVTITNQWDKNTTNWDEAKWDSQ